MTAPAARDGGAGTYYDRPVIAAPVWKPTIAVYLFAGGLAGASAGLGLVARLRGNHRLARSCRLATIAGLAASPALLIEDLGRPERFHHMLRVFKVTSPMSVGTWILTGFGALAGAGAASEMTGIARPLGRAADAGAAALGMPLATYTAALLADTSTPVWHQGRRHLPFLFAAGSAASAGAMAALVTPAEDGAMASRLAAGGAIAEAVLAEAMKRTAGEAARPYRAGPAAVMARAASALLMGGAAALAAGTTGRRRPWARPATMAGALSVLTGSLLERFAVWRAGTESARQTVR